MKSISLTQGRFALVDDCDYVYLCQYSWCVSDGYVVRSGYPDGKIYMHREILGFPDLDVDHSSGDTLDNRRDNLRTATVSQNMCNNRKRKDNTSGFKGVSQRVDTLRFTSYVNFQGKRHNTGCFDTAEEAAEARNKLAVQLHGEFMRAF